MQSDTIVISKWNWSSNSEPVVGHCSVMASPPYQWHMSQHNSCLKLEMEFKFITSGTLQFWSHLLSFTMDPAQLAYQQALRCHQAHLHMACLFSLFIRAIIPNVAAIIHAQYLKQPWHTSMLSGKMLSLMSFVLWATLIQNLSLLRSNWLSSSVALSLA